MDYEEKQQLKKGISKCVIRRTLNKKGSVLLNVQEVELLEI